MPKGAGSFPGAVLVHGSGPQDRDETIGPNKPFRDLAWGLASKGVAVLRYDERTKVYGSKMAAMGGRITVKEETHDDAAAAVKTLEAQPGVRGVALVGHSLGGHLAPRIAQADPSIQSLVVLAGTARPLEDVILDQYRYLATVPGSGVDAPIVKEMEAQVARVKSPSLPPSSRAREAPPPSTRS